MIKIKPYKEKNKIIKPYRRIKYLSLKNKNIVRLGGPRLNILGRLVIINRKRLLED
jgi:hypothetical protein